MDWNESNFMYCTFTVWLETLVNSKYLWFSTWVSRLNMLRNIEEATRMQLMFFLMVRNIFKIWWKSKYRVCIQRTEFTQIKLYLFYSVILFISLFMYLNPGFWSSFFLVFFRASINTVVRWQFAFWSCFQPDAASYTVNTRI